MSHNLFGNRFAGYRTPAWHNLGTVFTERISPTEGLRKIDGDFEIAKSPLFAEVPTLFGTHRIEIPGKFAIVREPTDDDLTYSVFGVCGADYEIVQRRQIAHALESLANRWPLETIGMLGQGETVFFTLAVGGDEIGGDEIRKYFLVTDTADGKTSLRIAFTPVRVVCQNTLDAGLRAAINTAILDHRQGVADDFEFRVDLIDRLAEKEADVMATFRQMADTEITAAQFAQIVAAAYPTPKPTKRMIFADLEGEDEKLAKLREQGQKSRTVHQYDSQHAEKLREGATFLYNKFNDEFPNTAGTAWAAWNAVTECADWRDGWGEVDAAALFGPRAKEKHRAYAEILKVTAA